MTEKLPEPNLEGEGIIQNDVDLVKKYPRLSGLPQGDWNGIIKRAEREGVSVEDLKLREGGGDDPAGLRADDPDKDLPGILERARRERRQLGEMKLRGGDEVRRIYESMYFLLAQAGFPVREYFDEETGPVTKRSLDLKDGMIKVIAEKKLDFGGGGK